MSLKSGFYLQNGKKQIDNQDKDEQHDAGCDQRFTVQIRRIAHLQHNICRKRPYSF